MRSHKIRDILKRAEKIANSQNSIVIIGEYGSGKSWLAKQIHDMSSRSQNPFLSINCYTLQENEAKEKIFGHLTFTETGVRINRGMFEQSKGGTIYFKGINAFSETLQSQIIEAVKGKKIFHLGSKQSIPINIRVIGSVDVKAFHNAQIKYNVMNTILGTDAHILFLPPLRFRREEIPYLAYNFLSRESPDKYNFITNEISPRALYLCIRYEWPGNVRQLKNAIEHASIISAGDRIQPRHLPFSIKEGQPDDVQLEQLENSYSFQIAEKKLLEKILHDTNSERETARLLEIDLKKLKKKLKSYNLISEVSK